MSKYITGQEIINDLGLHPFEFLDEYIKAGLIPLNNQGQTFSPYDVMAQLFDIPHHREALFQLKDSMHDLDDESVGSLRANRIIPLEQTIGQLEARLASYDGIEWANFALPENQEEAQYIFGVIQTSFFDRTKVVKMVGNKSGPQESEDAVFYAEHDSDLADELKATLPDQEGPKPHHTLKDKLRVQAKALELLEGKYKGYYAPQLADTEEMIAVSKKKNGKYYSREKIIEWINEVLPDDKKLKGAPPKIN